MLETGALDVFAMVSVLTLIVVYFFLITEKLNKALVAGLGAVSLIVAQVFRTTEHTSQENALEFVSANLDILGFVVGMMILVGIIRESGVFEATAIWMVQRVKGKPLLLLVVWSYLTLLMTTFFSNIPTVLILTPVILILINQLKLPAMPYLFGTVVMANIGGAMTPISDPTTYYQAKTVGLSFMEVLMNSGMIVLLLSVVSVGYMLVVFRKQLSAIQVDAGAVSAFKPKRALKNMRMLWLGLPLLVIAIVLMVLKEPVHSLTGITLDNATITMAAAGLAMLIFHKEPKNVFSRLIDWEILFFFMGLFIVVGALEFTGVIALLAGQMVAWTGGAMGWLLFLMSTGSALISTFIDNVPYNITMVGAIQAMEAAGLTVYPLWWGLNLGTSIGGLGSPIAAACNVIVFGQAEGQGVEVSFVRYLKLSMPLVLLNSFVAFGVLWWRFL